MSSIFHKFHPPGMKSSNTAVAALVRTIIAAAWRNPRSPKKAAAKLMKAAKAKLVIPINRKPHSNSLLEVKPMIEIALPGLIISAKAMTPKSSAVDLKSKVTRYSSTLRPYSEYLKVERVFTLN
jgi:hypothetical protein